MSDGGINFHGDVGKVHTGEGDNVDGDKVMGDQDKSQHSTTETNVAGDMHGDIKGGDNIQGGQTNELAEYVDNLEAEFNKAVAEQNEILSPRKSLLRNLQGLSPDQTTRLRNRKIQSIQLSHHSRSSTLRQLTQRTRTRRWSFLRCVQLHLLHPSRSSQRKQKGYLAGSKLWRQRQGQR